MRVASFAVSIACHCLGSGYPGWSWTTKGAIDTMRAAACGNGCSKLRMPLCSGIQWHAASSRMPNVSLQGTASGFGDGLLLARRTSCRMRISRCSPMLSAHRHELSQTR